MRKDQMRYRLFVSSMHSLFIVVVFHIVKALIALASTLSGVKGCDL